MGQGLTLYIYGSTRYDELGQLLKTHKTIFFFYYKKLPTQLNILCNKNLLLNILCMKKFKWFLRNKGEKKHLEIWNVLEFSIENCFSLNNELIKTFELIKMLIKLFCSINSHSVTLLAYVATTKTSLQWWGNGFVQDCNDFSHKKKLSMGFLCLIKNLLICLIKNKINVSFKIQTRFIRFETFSSSFFLRDLITKHDLKTIQKLRIYRKWHKCMQFILNEKKNEFSIRNGFNCLRGKKTTT